MQGEKETREIGRWVEEIPMPSQRSKVKKYRECGWVEEGEESEDADN